MNIRRVRRRRAMLGALTVAITLTLLAGSGGLALHAWAHLGGVASTRRATPAVRSTLPAASRRAAVLDRQTTPTARTGLSARAILAQASTYGIDIADYQDEAGPINWGQVASANQFVYIKATEGGGGDDLYVNPYYQGDRASALAQGMSVGGYEFAAPDQASGAAEAQYFLSQSGYSLGNGVLTPMIDLENDPYDANTPCYGLSNQSMISWLQSYVQTIQSALGRAPVFYTGTPWWDQCTGDSSAFTADPLWIASYGVSYPTIPAGFDAWDLWQYNVGTTPGISGSTDLDVFNGSTGALAAQLGQSVVSSSGPAIVAGEAPGRLDVFYVGSGGNIWDGVTQGGATTQTNLGGLVAPNTSPAAVSWAPGRLDVFVEGTNDQLYHDAWNGSQWSGWFSLGGTLTSSPTVASWAPGRLDVFAAGPGGAVQHLWYSGGVWLGWETLGGTVYPGTAPTAVSWSAYRIDLFVTGTDQQWWHQWFNSSGWQAGYEVLGGTLISSPSVASWGAGRLDVFAESTNGALQHLWYSSGWFGWEQLGGALESAPSATSSGIYSLNVAVRGTDSGTWVDTFGSGGWAGFVEFGDYST